MNIAEFTRAAGPVPFLDRGRTYAGWDCWGLICCAYRDVLGIRLPEFTGYASAQDVNAVGKLIEANKASAWRKLPIGQAAPMDVVLMNFEGHPVHVGLAVDARTMLHTFAKGGTVRERIFNPLAPNRVEGIYRHAA